jgi:hypothetical protein
MPWQDRYLQPHSPPLSSYSGLIKKHGIRQDSIAPGAVFFPAGDIRTIQGDTRTIQGNIRAGLFLHAFQAF